MKILNFTLLLLSCGLIITGCGGGSENSDTSSPTSETKLPLTKENITSIILPNNSKLPPKPDKTENNKTLSGVDANNNNIRDDLEHIAYQSTQFAQTSDKKEEYEKLIELIKYIQPTGATSQIIEQHKFYCEYRNLPENVRDNISMQRLQDIVTDTLERKKAFYNSLVKTSGNTGEEICQ